MANIKTDLEALKLWGPWGFESDGVVGDSEDYTRTRGKRCCGGRRFAGP